MRMRMQAVLAKHSNLADLLALFFRDDIVAWTQRRAQRGAGLRTAQLKQLVDANVDNCLRRMAEVAPSQPSEVCVCSLPLPANLNFPITMPASMCEHLVRTGMVSAIALLRHVRCPECAARDCMVCGTRRRVGAEDAERLLLGRERPRSAYRGARRRWWMQP